MLGGALRCMAGALGHFHGAPYVVPLCSLTPLGSLKSDWPRDQRAQDPMDSPGIQWGHPWDLIGPPLGSHDPIGPLGDPMRRPLGSLIERPISMITIVIQMGRPMQIGNAHSFIRARRHQSKNNPPGFLSRGPKKVFWFIPS